MGNFLRFAALILLLLIGFGSGICGLFGLGAVAVDQISGHSGSTMDFSGVALVLSIIGLIVAALCIWGIRVLARGLKRTAQADAESGSATPPSEPPPA
jgi:hypothetical protein